MSKYHLRMMIPLTGMTYSDLRASMVATSWRRRSSTTSILGEPSGEELSNVLRGSPIAHDFLRFPFGNARQSDTLELIHDAFQPLSFWNGWQTPPAFQGVAMDTHIYHMFSPDARIFFCSFTHLAILTRGI
jgi:hypothetical protein